MKHFFECEYCKTMYDNEKAALECEAKHKEEKERREKLNAEKSARRAEIREMDAKLKDMIKKYNEDYHTFKTSNSSELNFDELFDYLDRIMH